RVLRRHEVGLRLLPILQRAALRVVEFVRSLFVDLRLRELRARCLEGSDRGDQVVHHLHEFGRLDGEERRARGNDITEFGDKPGDTPRIGREDRRVEVVVDRDVAFRHPLRAKAAHLNNLDLQTLPLRFGWPKAAGLRPGDSGRRRRRLTGAIADKTDRDGGASKSYQHGHGGACQQSPALKTGQHKVTPTYGGRPHPRPSLSARTVRGLKGFAEFPSGKETERMGPSRCYTASAAAGFAMSELAARGMSARGSTRQARSPGAASSSRSDPQCSEAIAFTIERPKPLPGMLRLRSMR